jgi:hypothetical protein
VLRKLLQDFLRFLLIVPETAGGGELIEFRYFGFAARQVKETSAVRRAWTSTR